MRMFHKHVYRDGAGKISGFAVHAGRIRNVRFSKFTER